MITNEIATRSAIMDSADMILS